MGNIRPRGARHCHNIAPSKKFSLVPPMCWEPQPQQKAAFTAPLRVRVTLRVMVEKTTKPTAPGTVELQKACQVELSIKNSKIACGVSSEILLFLKLLLADCILLCFLLQSIQSSGHKGLLASSLKASWEHRTVTCHSHIKYRTFQNTMTQQ